MTSTPTTRPATPADLDAIAELEADVFGADAWSAALVADLLTPAHQLVRVTGEGAVNGYVVLSATGDTVDLQRIAVAPAQRRAGLAGTLLAEGLEAVQDRTGDDPASQVLLEVAASNTGARAFYERTGFTTIATRRRYYADGTDALVMRLPLDGAEHPDEPQDEPDDQAQQSQQSTNPGENT